MIGPKANPTRNPNDSQLNTKLLRTGLAGTPSHNPESEPGTRNPGPSLHPHSLDAVASAELALQFRWNLPSGPLIEECMVIAQ